MRILAPVLVVLFTLACGLPGCGGGDPPSTGPDAGMASDGGPSAESDGTPGSGCAGSCGMPPANVCVDGKKLRAYVAQGTCSSGACTYAGYDVVCTMACQDGSCTGNDACKGVTCVAPPAASCVDGSTLKVYGPSGTCAGGTCSYASVTTPCANGCAGGACVGEPCAGVTCTSPPGASCVNGTTRRSYGATGTCGGGTCTYSPTDTPCGSAPANADAVCTNGACAFACRAGFARSGGGCVSTAGPTAGPSCAGLAKTCGPSGTGDCCASSVVPGGTYNRINDVTYPATVSSFRLDTYEITVGRFRKFVGAYSQNMIAAGAGKNPNNPSDPGWDSSWNASLPSDAAALRTVVNCHATYQTWSDSPSGGESRPMNCMTWHAAEAFCTWDGGRLPTEAEWNYAAAGGNEQRRYPWGNTEPGLDAKLAVYDCRYNGTGPCSGITNIASVGSVSAGNGKWGHSDMAGNVWEWVQDGYASPMAAACTNCADLTDSSFRVYRGGGFHQRASFLLVSYRDYYAPKVRSYPFGARCARTP